MQLVNKAESSPELELILSKHYIIDAPNTNSSVTSSMSTSSSSNENTSTQDVGDMIYNRVSNKIADLVDREFDKSSSRTSMINNEVRVYKGGSWKDRDYWLDPAQRRYFPQDMATDYIGFRCAMSRVGSKTTQPKRARH